MNPAAHAPAHAREALRQQMLLRALWRDARPGVVAGWMRDGARFERGLRAYQAHAGALAERALAAAYPTIRQLVGVESFAGLARAFWQREGPACGDVATWGGGLPAFIADAESLADEPCLPDVARLDWAVHLAGGAADGVAAPQGLELLALNDPAQLSLAVQPGTALVASTHPVAAIWQAHRRSDEDRFAPVRQAYAQGRGETALVWRQGFRVEVAALPDCDAAFAAALLRDGRLAPALAAAAPDFQFEPWLLAALRQGWLAGVHLLTHPE
jgi:hypothetical protein